MIYNDAYALLTNDRDPQLLGRKVRDGWHEVVSFNGHVMSVGLADSTLSYADHELKLHRHDCSEQILMNLGHWPILGQDGAPISVIAFE